MKVRVDPTICVATGSCEAIAPTVFRVGEENVAEVLDPDSVDEATLREATESCPVGAIILEDDEGNQIYP